MSCGFGRTEDVRRNTQVESRDGDRLRTPGCRPEASSPEPEASRYAGFIAVMTHLPLRSVPLAVFTIAR